MTASEGYPRIGPINTEATRPNLTASPPSDPTAGERCELGCLGHGGQGVCPHCGEWHADDFSCCLATPPADDASEIEALAKVLADARTDGEWIAMSAWHRTCFESDGTRLLASDWLAAREAAARAEAWDEGYDARAGYMELRNEARREDNPYREAR